MLLHIPMTVKLQNQPPYPLTVKVNHPSVALTTAIEATRFALEDFTNPVEFVR